MAKDFLGQELQVRDKVAIIHCAEVMSNSICFLGLAKIIAFEGEKVWTQSNKGDTHIRLCRNVIKVPFGGINAI